MTIQGADHQWAKLTADEVRAIRRKYDESLAAGEGVYAIIKRLGAEYGKAPNTIYYIGKRKTWQSLGEDNETVDGSKGS